VHPGRGMFDDFAFLFDNERRASSSAEATFLSVEGFKFARTNKVLMIYTKPPVAPTGLQRSCFEIRNECRKFHLFTFSVRSPQGVTYAVIKTLVPYLITFPNSR